MVEAVSSIASNATYTKAVVQQQSVAQTYAPVAPQVAQSPQAPFLSLFLKVDVNFDKAVLQIRDTETGDVVRQIPTESQLEAYRRAQASNAIRPATAEESAPIVSQKKDIPVEASSSTSTTQSQPQVTTPQVQATPQIQTAVVSTAASTAPAPQAQGSSVDTSA